LRSNRGVLDVNMHVIIMVGGFPDYDAIRAGRDASGATKVSVGRFSMSQGSPSEGRKEVERRRLYARSTGIAHVPGRDIGSKTIMVL
jgi:hypothetical protein